MRSLPAVQWKTAGSASGEARTSRAARIWLTGVADDLQVLRAEQARSTVEVLRIGELVDEGEVVERHRVGLDVEPAALELGSGAQVDHRPDAETAQHGEVGLGQLAQTVGPEERAPACPRAVAGHVAAQIAEIDRALQRDQPLQGLCHLSAPLWLFPAGPPCSLHAWAAPPEHVRELQVTKPVRPPACPTEGTTG